MSVSLDFSCSHQWSRTAVDAIGNRPNYQLAPYFALS